MNRIHQGRVRKVEIACILSSSTGERNEVGCKLNFSEIVDMALPAEGVFHNLVFVGIRKTNPMQAYKSPGGRPPSTACRAWGK